MYPNETSETNGENKMNYYLTTNHNGVNWAKRPTTIAIIEGMGWTVEDTRSHADKRIVAKGQTIGYLYESKAAQMAHLAKLGAI